MGAKSQSEDKVHYFVDEAGDGVLFNKRGRLIIGEEGCSRYFMLGLLHMPNPEILSAELEVLRQKLLNDPYFKKVPSMQPENRKTALVFHAKDDLPEIRREMFSLLHAHQGLRFFAVVKDKTKVAEYAIERRKKEPTYRYNPNELYDHLVKRLFKERLHQANEYEICFAKRGNSNRTKALRQALEEDFKRNRISQVQPF